MMRQTLMMTLLFAVVAMADVEPMHDISYPKYTYHYHAVPQKVFNEWQEHKKSVNVTSTDSNWNTWLEDRKNTMWEKCKTAVRTVLEKYAFEIGGIGLTVFVVFLLWRLRYKVALLCFLFAAVVLFGLFKPMSSEGVITVTVKPNDDESYDQYQTRVYSKNHGLCDVCGKKLRWYDGGCPKCSGGRRHPVRTKVIPIEEAFSIEDTDNK